MGAVIDVGDLTDYMSGIDLTAEQRSAADDVIDGVEQELSAYLNRPLTPVTVTETVTPEHDGTLFLKNTPVQSVTSITWPYGTITGWQVSEGGVTIPLLYSLPVTVTYTGGIDASQINAIRLGVLRVAAREMQNRHDDTLSVKELSTQGVPALPEGWQDGELRRLQRWKKRVLL